MCVVMIVQEDDKRPTEKMVNDAFNRNMDGGGAAWREAGKTGPEVHWKKGLTRAEMLEMAPTLPVPFILHFRLKSIGEVKPQMCHPFPVDKDASVALEGRTKSAVFFHNGTWHKWDDFLLNVAIQTGAKIPVGKWSDTRAMAWLSSILGYGLLEILDAKGVAFGPVDMDIFQGTGWEKVNGIWVSNTLFMNTYTGGTRHIAHGYGTSYDDAHDPLPAIYRPGPTVSSFPPRDGGETERVYCIYDRCTKKDIDETGYCPEHTSKKKSLTQTTPPSGVGTGHRDKTKNKPSPCQDIVDQAREVASTQGPFLGKTFIEAQRASSRLSHSQYKKLLREFDDQILRGKRAQEAEIRRVGSSMMMLPGD